MAKVILLLIVFGVLQATFSAPSDGKKNNAYLLYEIYTPIGSLKKFRLSQTTIHRQSFFFNNYELYKYYFGSGNQVIARVY